MTAEEVKLWMDGIFETGRRLTLIEELTRLKALIGAAVWYYDRERGDWRLAVVVGVGTKDGCPLADVLLDGRPRWGYGWQFVQSESKPALPDLSQTYP